MAELTRHKIECPHCAYHYQIEIDSDEGDEDYYEDCPSCCCSIHITLGHSPVDGEMTVSVDGDDEQIF
jgi:hypothetical protein